MVGKGIFRVFDWGKIEEKFLLICGVSVGLLVVFYVLLVGVMFLFEEVYKNFLVFVLIFVMIVFLIVDYILVNFLGMEFVF